MDARRDVLFALLARRVPAALLRRQGTPRAGRRRTRGRGLRSRRRGARARHRRARREPLRADRHRSAPPAVPGGRAVARRDAPRVRSPGRARPPPGRSGRSPGAEQVIVLSSAPPPGRPHELSAGRADLRGRAAEQLFSFEAGGSARLAGARRGPLRRPLPDPSGAQPARPARLLRRLRRAIRSPLSRSASWSIAATRTPTTSSSSRSSPPAASASKRSNPDW